MKKILKWFKTSFQDRQGNASSRKLTAFIGMVMFVISWYMNVFKDKNTDPIILYSIVVITGLSFGLFTIDNIISFAKAIRQPDYGYGMGYNDNTNILINNKKKEDEQDPPVLME